MGLNRFNHFFMFIFFVSTSISQTGLLEENINLGNISHRVILIGDAGEPAEDFDEPVLLALSEQASLIPDSTFVIFLGDNIYPCGLTPGGDDMREEYERRIDEQINAVIRADALGLFIPGNHDWDEGSDNGWDQINRQSEYVLNKNLTEIKFAPLNGCPGPEVIDFGTGARIIILDTQWWLQDEGTRPEPEDSICDFATEKSVINALDSILNVSTGKFIILAAHHPLKTHGSHGGHFGWEDHIFPLRNLSEVLWIPLPIIGSLYPLSRMMGITNQDLSHPDYRNMIEEIESVISRYDNLVVASGHEHALQILQGVNGNKYLVSGAGIWGHVTESLTNDEDTIFAERYEGFMILDFLRDGRIRLTVIKVIDEIGKNSEVFSIFLTG